MYIGVRIERGIHHSTLGAVQSLLGDMAGLRFLFVRIRAFLANETRIVQTKQN